MELDGKWSSGTPTNASMGCWHCRVRPNTLPQHSSLLWHFLTVSLPKTFCAKGTRITALRLFVLWACFWRSAPTPWHKCWFLLESLSAVPFGFASILRVDDFHTWSGSPLCPAATRVWDMLGTRFLQLYWKTDTVNECHWHSSHTSKGFFII